MRRELKVVMDSVWEAVREKILEAGPPPLMFISVKEVFEDHWETELYPVDSKALLDIRDSALEGGWEAFGVLSSACNSSDETPVSVVIVFTCSDGETYGRAAFVSMDKDGAVYDVKDIGFFDDIPPVISPWMKGSLQ